MHTQKNICIFITILIMLCVSGCSDEYKKVVEQTLSFENKTCDITENEDKGCLINGYISENFVYKINKINSKEAKITIDTIDFSKITKRAYEEVEYSDDYDEYINNLQDYIISKLENNDFEMKTEEITLNFEKSNETIYITNIEELSNAIYGNPDEID